jgi:D-glycero-D-manno-heptose 1,7-bisphosphate phosphatase
VGIDEVTDLDELAGTPTRKGVRKAVFLDRDGTLIDVVRDEEIGAITVAFHPDQIRFLPGVIDGLRLLRDAGYALGIATNQPAPAKGQFSRAAVERTNAALVARLAAEDIVIEQLAVCMHHTKRSDGGDDSLITECTCRKPKPGLLHTLLAGMNVAPENAWMVGDSSGDVEAGKAAGVRTALVFSTTRCELCPLRGGPKCAPTLHADGFLQLAQRIAAG